MPRHFFLSQFRPAMRRLVRRVVFVVVVGSFAGAAGAVQDQGSAAVEPLTAQQNQAPRRSTGLQPPPPDELNRMIAEQQVQATNLASVTSPTVADKDPAAVFRIPTAARALAGERPPGDKLPDELPAAFDWAEHGVITGAKNQGGCGCCWAFATIAALESSFRIYVNPSLPIDLSERFVLDHVPSNDCRAGFWREPFNLMREYGTVPEGEYPYPDDPDERPPDKQAKLPVVRSGEAARGLYKAAGWDFVAKPHEPLPSDDALKLGLLKYGPLVVGYCAGPRFTYDHKDTDAAFAVREGDAANHALLLIGWDDAKDGGAWKVKNSWGVNWGRNGFGWIRYGVNKLGHGAAWVRAAPRAGASDSDLQDAVAPVPAAEVVEKWDGGEFDHVTRRVRKVNGQTIEVWEIRQPNVKQRLTRYPRIKFHANDAVKIQAGGCVQTGGVGRTWKRYVDPQSDKGIYFGQIYFEGMWDAPRRLSSFQEKGANVLLITKDCTLALGYVDDRHDDNGYWGRDDGTGGQCRGEENAYVILTVAHQH